ncbi:MAG TPA: YbaK/EbsC family protein [Methylomusa anaerophila]|uniref:Cys-tRNA(Pro)/Cys-tRNA(Cys) deacylase YbaK n=1 Tax=Methylomusa anaerophila TaxID=1930071 RepID=A0A348AQC4_9FIRM|nr:YbaK/EbsC family protein [Methylomusa anaerophila]BBB93272.1 Cys-tRNA(Pro)/Cys-tRNA(Cys) deacylase YbaK [Methylomusa anaerophila]HML86896.1 YbaK/EbsC family protein [Methylomusa anaerophila]
MPLERVRKVIASYPELKIILFEESTHTSELAAQALGVLPAQIAKTLLFTTDDQAALVVTCGDRRVNTKLLKKVLGVHKVKFADADTVMNLTGFPPGGVSPLGAIQPIPIYLDKSLYAFDVVYTAAGTANSALPISPKRLEELTGARIIDVCSVG